MSEERTFRKSIKLGFDNSNGSSALIEAKNILQPYYKLNKKDVICMIGYDYGNQSS